MMVKATAELALSISTVSSLVLGVLVIFVGATIRSNGVIFINMYGESLVKELPEDMCVDPASGLDFCEWSVNLKDVHLGQSISVFGSVLIICGASIALLSVLGFCAACGLKVLLFLMLVVSCVAVGLEAYIIDIVTNEEGEFHDWAKSELLQLLKYEYKLAKTPDDSLTQAFNVIMLQAECCGVLGPNDFGGNLTYKRADGFVYKFYIPPACCSRATFKKKKFQAFIKQHGCPEELDSHTSHPPPTNNKQGCYTVVFKHIYDEYGKIIFDILLLLMLLHTIDIALAVAILMRPVSERHTSFRKSDRQSLSMNFARESRTSMVGFRPFALTRLSLETRGPKKEPSTQVW